MENAIFSFSFEEKYYDDDISANLDRALASVTSGNGSHFSASSLHQLHARAQMESPVSRASEAYKAVLNELVYKKTASSLREEVHTLRHRLVMMELLHKKAKERSDWYLKFWDAMK